MTRFYEILVAAGFLVFNAVYLYLALALPKSPLADDVGPAQLPVAIALFGLVLAVLYLIQSWRKQGETKDGISPKLLVFVGLTVLASVLSPFIGMALTLALFAAIGVVLLDGMTAWRGALITGACMFIIGFVGFSWLLDLPLP
ncbi:tripartite tricarboxylate transporter TctB family protein [uncultured Thalassospira sp.]|jgi:phosphoglycerol transferase MdoB-like AlkP superfamily enzyme|uniref:tripartite tricarboxylate transporter TctB family protein n=1 Tax=uncultured Thalassospira sp. TaxID=404382 RepID=UPI0030DAB428|tara:strand:+ start:131 stop:559 length:429 start_codon:yes stop_codon:yes gene_type:complete